MVEIVRRLDGLPLAIELAAARLRVLPVGRDRRPARRPVPAADRRQPHRGAPAPTLRAVVEWSWDLLDRRERLLAERLSRVPGGRDSRRRDRGLADDRRRSTDVVDLLLALVDKSLLQIEATAGRCGTGCWRRSASTAWSGWPSAASSAPPGSRTPAISPTWPTGSSRRCAAPGSWTALRILDAERENMLAALRFLGDSGRPREALAMALALNWYWSLIGSSSEAVTWLGFVVAINEADPPPELIFAKAGLALSRVTAEEEGADDSSGVVDWESAIDDMTALTAELVDAPPAPYPGLEALRPMVAHFARRPDLADAMIERGIRSPDRWVRAALLATAAFSAENDSDVAAMRRTAGVAYEEFCQIGDRWGLSSCLLVMARLATLDDRIDDAAGYYDEAWRYLSEIGASNDDEIYIRIRIADLTPARANGTRRVARSRRVQRGGELISDRAMFAESTLAQIDWMSGDLDAALTLARDLRKRLADRPQSSGPVNHLTAVVLATSGALEAGVGRFDQAKADLRTAYAAGVASGDMPILCIVGLAAAAYAVERQEFCAGAVILGATAQIRGADDPGDPTVIMLPAGCAPAVPPSRPLSPRAGSSTEQRRSAPSTPMGSRASRPGWRRRR